MRTAHAGRALTHEAYAASIENLATVLEELGVGEDDIANGTTRVEARRAACVGSRRLRNSRKFETKRSVVDGT
ncbi:MAG: hypothetical protein LH471_08695 [Salinibacterium sp.]|nr:hypothetical protein [Salinibacterium sp.]